MSAGGLPLDYGTTYPDVHVGPPDDWDTHTDDDEQHTDDEPDNRPPLPPSWQPRPLADYRTVTPPAASALPVQGSRGLLYPGRSHAIYGEPGCGKSWLLVAAAVAALRADPAGWVLILDLEDEPGLWASRFAQVGVPADELRRVSYTRPREPIGFAQLPRLVEHAPALVGLDGLTEVFQLHGQDTDNPVDTARVMRYLNGLTDTGAALLVVDHVTKDRANRRFAIGSGHKLAALTGAAYRIEADSDLPIRRQHVGSSRLLLTKDRPGAIPCRVDREAARIFLDDRQDPSRLTVRPGEDWG